MEASAVMFVFFMSLWRFSQSAGEMLTVTPLSGQDAVLQCLYPDQDAVTKIMWTRQNLRKPVLFFRENRSHESYQDPAFVGRVRLRDPQIGDFSLNLTKVTANDSGLYECVVSSSSRTRSRRAVAFRQAVRLTVRSSAASGGNAEPNHAARAAPAAPDDAPSGPPAAGGPELHVVLPVVSLVLGGVIVVGLVVFRRHSSKGQQGCFTLTKPSENLQDIVTSSFLNSTAVTPPESDFAGPKPGQGGGYDEEGRMKRVG